MVIEKLSLKHQDLLDPLFKKLSLNISEYSFANAYLFRNVHDFHVHLGQAIYLKGKTRDGYSYLMPTSVDLKWEEIKELLHSIDFLFPLPEEWGSKFDSNQFQITHFEMDSDYLFGVDKLKNFPGRHLSGRRNLLKQFKENYPEYRSCLLTDALVSDALAVLEKWQEHVPENFQFTDYDSCKEALQLFNTLHLKGHLTYVGNIPIGFVLGEPLNKNTYIFQFAKGLIEYKGIYQYLYNEFANSLEKNFEFINLEQDLGSAELAHAKHAYLPDRLVPKLRVALKR